MREVISSKLKIDYGKDEDGVSRGSWTISKLLPTATAEQVFELASNLNSLQSLNDVAFYRITQHSITA